MMEQIYTEFDLSTFGSKVLHKRNSQLLQGGERKQ